MRDLEFSFIGVVVPPGDRFGHAFLLLHLSATRKYFRSLLGRDAAFPGSLLIRPCS